MFDWLADPQAWLTLFTLSAIEIVLGIDNLVFISIAVSKLPHEKREKARKFGIAVACITRIALLLTLAWLAGLTADLFSLFGQGISMRDLARIATLVKDRGYRQVWRFEHGGRAYYLKFYPRPSGAFSREAWRRRFRGSPAYREFERLQRLQKASIPAPRAVAYLAGLRVADASIMPTVIRGHTNAPAIVIGEVAADLIRASHPLTRRDAPSLAVERDR